MLSTLHHLAEVRRQYGTAAAVHWVADRLARRLLGASMVRVVWLEADWLPDWIRPDPSLDFRFLEPDEVRYFAGDPVYELEAAMAEQIEAGSDLCFGALAGGRLAAYGWYALGGIEAEHACGVAMSFPPDVAYMYKGLTHADFRGRRLYALSMGLALRDLAEYGVTKLVCLVESTNWAARRSCARLGFADLGLRLSLGWGRCRYLRVPTAAQQLGVRLGKHAGPRSAHPARVLVCR
jgi:ribosomal protein S18 acetylase RimI-like enzyme